MPTLAERLERRGEERDADQAQRDNPIPAGVKERIDRGRSRMKDGAAERDEVLHFIRGNQYVHQTAKGYLIQQNLISNPDGSGKPPHRLRQPRNLMIDVITRKVSAATSRIPSFEVAPSTTDPEDISAARLAEKVLLYGYDKWGLREAAERCIGLAVGPGEGFAWPYFDNTVGPYIKDDQGKVVTGVGEIRVRVFNGNQVMWEPNLKFSESRWVGVQLAMVPDEVRQLPGYLGGPLATDAASDDLPTGGPDKASVAHQVLVTHYLERPCPKYPDGRWLTIANGRQITAERKYPCVDHKGRVLDEPVLHKLAYFVDYDNDRDFGLGRHLVPAQRSRNDCINKLGEWKNIALVPQIFVTPGLMKRQRLTDEPGAIYEIPQPDQNLKWRDVPPVPQALFQMLDQADADIARISAQNDIPSQVESGRGIEALLESDRSRDALFISQVAEWWSDLARHCLYLTQRHYSEGDDRLVKLQGRFGPELVTGFKGADLRGQADVRVRPGSLEPRSRQQIEQKILAFADRGWVSPQAAMAAINGGTAEALVEDYEKDVAWANRTIQKILAGPEVLFAEAPREETGPDGMPREVPAWMPRPFQNIPVIKAVFESWMKSVEYEQLEPGMREAADKLYAGLEQIEADKAAKAAAQQVQMAEGLGMANAAKPQGEKPMPDAPSPTPGGDNLPTPNQPPEQSMPS